MNSSAYIFVWAIMATTMAVYWYFLWRTTKRWNTLLRRAGMTPDDDAWRKTTKIVGFVLSSRHKSFEDEKLSQLVLYTRCLFFAVLICLAIWVMIVGL